MRDFAVFAECFASLHGPRTDQNRRLAYLVSELGRYFFFLNKDFVIVWHLWCRNLHIAFFFLRFDFDKGLYLLWLNSTALFLLFFGRICIIFWHVLSLIFIFAFLFIRRNYIIVWNFLCWTKFNAGYWFSTSLELGRRVGSFRYRQMFGAELIIAGVWRRTLLS